MRLSFKTPAKINLGLHISHKREDGYHELETLLQMVSLYDAIELTTLPAGIELECDTPGIPKDQREIALQPFERLDKSRSATGSVGLGLSIAADIARAHGGTLKLGDSTDLGGLSVRLIVPR